ncbi:hypothetical protein ANAEL_03774 [Anaerolineales bacterium]|nr:hypothetical protein ANAEL_03774 [Anaerolineales bacterium]
MSIGLFTDKRRQPTDAEIRQAVGPKLSLWEAFIGHIREKYPAEEDFKFLYGKNYGWARRFRIKGQLLTSLYPTNGGFTVQINLSPDAIEKAQNMKLTQNARLAIECANPYPEGRWLFIPVESKSDLQSVQQLLALRVENKNLLKELSG